MTKEQSVNEIHAKLAGLRASLRWRLVTEAIAWVLICMVFSVFITLAFDYVLHMERILRGIMMAVALVAVVWTLCRHLIAPLLIPMTSDDLALLVESRYGQLGDRLISAIQFERAVGPGESPLMVAHVMDEAGRLADDLDMAPLVDRARLRRVQAICACALALLVGFACWRTDIMSLWLQRNVAFAQVDWPQDTYLEVEGGPDFTVLRGDDLTVVVAASSASTVVPHHITLHAKYPSVGWTQERLDLTESGDHIYTKVFRGVSEEFEFYVTGNDDSRDKRREHKVGLIDPPALNKCEFVVEYPAYMNIDRERVPGSEGVLLVPLASTIQIHARSTKPLRSAALMLDGKEVGDVTWPDGAAADSEKTAFVGRFIISAPPDEEGKQSALPMILSFALTDTDGYSNKGGQKYTIEVRKDQTPSVDLRKRAVGEAVTPQAIIPLVIKAEDDYGLASGQVVLAVKSRKLTMSQVGISLPLPVRREAALRRDVDLKGRGLIPGDVLSLSVELLDTLPERLGGPNRGMGGPLRLRIVESEELMAQLVGRQKSISEEFVQAMALQRSARNGAASVLGVLKSGKITPEVQRILKMSGSSQASVGSECAKAAEALSALLEEMTYNRLGSGQEHEEMRSGVIEPMNALAQPITSTAALLNQARSVDDAKELIGRIESITIVQDDMLRIMGEILERMHKIESRQDMINALRRILKWSEDQLQDIKKEGTSEAATVFDETSDKTENNN